MDRIWTKLDEHERALARIEARVENLPTQRQLLVGLILFVVSLIALVYGVGSYMAGTMSTALAAIQTVVAERPPVAASASVPPTVIVIPSHARPIAPTK